MLEIGNYIIHGGHIVKVVELYASDLHIEYKDGSRLTRSYDDIRFMELKEKDLLLLRDGPEGPKVVTRMKGNRYTYHTKEDYQIDLRGSKFYIHGFLFDGTSVWQYSNLITLHYMHQLQNLVKLLNPKIDLVL